MRRARTTAANFFGEGGQAALTGGPSIPGSGDHDAFWKKGLVTGVVVADLFVIGLVGGVVTHERRRAFEEVSTIADNYSRTLEQSLVGFIGRIDSTLLTAADEVEREKAQGGIRDEELNAFLARQDSHIRETRGLRVMDERGNVRFAVDGVNTQGANLGDRPYFIRVRDDPKAGLVFSEPVMGRVSDRWVVTLSRRINNPDGSFGGEVNVAVATDRFRDMLGSIDLGTKGVASLWSRTEMIARYGAEDPRGVKTGTPLPSPQLRGLIESGKTVGSYHIVTRLDDVARFYQFRQVGDYPLYVMVGLADADFLSTWRRDFLRLAVMAAAFCVGSGLFAWLTLRFWRQREKSEDELRATAARLGLVLKTAAEGIIGLDEDWRVMFATPAAAAILGWPSAEAMQDGVSHEIVGHILADRTPCDGTTCRIRTAVAKGETVRVMDEFFTRRDGTAVPVEYVVAPLAVSDASAGAVIAFHDISERKQAEAELWQSKERLEAAASAGIVGIWDWDIVADRLIWDKVMCQLYGMPPGGFGGTYDEWTRAVHPEDLPHAEAEVQAALRGEREYAPEFRVIWPDGSVHHIKAASRTTFDDQGRPFRMIGVNYDITEQKKAEHMLAAVNVELQQFAYLASHDMREPLRMISSYLALLERHLGSDLDGDSRDFLAFAKDGAQRLDRMILGLLDYSRIGRDAQPKAPVPLGEVVDEAVANLGVAIETAQARVAVPVPLPAVLGSRNELVRLLQNVIGNAVKYGAPDRTPLVTVTASRADSTWVVSVADNGVGIAADDRERIFGIFQRLHGADVEGCGIGLASCKKIVEHHGGRIWVESEPGRGSTFFFTLPAAA